MGKLWKTRLLRHYWVTYCCLALIPLLILAATLIISQNNSYAEMARSLYLRSITQTATHLDGVVSDMQATVNSMSSNAYLEELMARPEAEPQFENAMTAYLRNAEENSRVPIRALFYGVGSTSIYTADGLMDYQAFEQSLNKRVNLNCSRFFTLLNSTTSMQTWMLAPADNTPPDELPMAAFAFPVLTENLRKSGTFVFLVDTEVFLEIICGYLGIQPDFLYLYNANYSSAISLYETEKQAEAARARAIQSSVGIVSSIRLGGKSYDILHYKSDLYGFQIITCIQLDNLYGGMDDMQLDTAMLLAVLALLILIAAFFLARSFYKPVRGLLSSIGDDAADDELDEFSRIDQHLSTMHTEMTALQERLAMQRPMVRDRLILALLRSTLDENGLRQLESVCPDIQLNRQWIYVALVAADKQSRGDQLMLFEKLDLDGADVHGVFLEEERMLALLILSLEEADRRLEQCCQLRELLLRQGVELPKISAGQKVLGADQVPASFLEAYIAMNSRMGSGDKDIFLYCPDQPVVSSRAGWPLACDNSMNIYLQSLRSVDQRTALTMLHTVLDAMCESCASLLNISYARFDLFSRALRLCEESVAQRFSPRVSAMEQLTDAERFAQLMEELTCANCAAVEQKRSSSYEATRTRILAVIREHCFEPSFSLSELSDLVGYSATYINRCLREETGYSFIQYVSMLRIAKAKKALVETDDKIKDIVTRLGYQDLASFTRKFKEYEGVTPMEYRAINRRGG